MTITNSTLSGNTVVSDYYRPAFDARGGGLFVAGGIVAINNSTIGGNYSWGYSEGFGGGVHNDGGTVSVTNSTFAFNTSLGLAGIHHTSGSTHVTNSTFRVAGVYGPGTGARTITNSVIYPGSDSYARCQGFSDDGNNFGCGGPTSPDVTNLDVTLSDNGGPTFTYELLEGSNAIDAAGNCASLDPVLVADQRAAPRFDGACDSGAFEFGGCPLLELMDDMVVTTEVYEECEIHAGPGFSVLGPGGDLTLTAGKQVVLFDGVEIDGTATIGLDPDLQITAALEAAARAGFEVP